MPLENHSPRFRELVTAPLIIFFCYALPAVAGTNRFTAEIISQSERATNLSHLVWHPAGQQVTYLRPAKTTNTTRDVLYAFDVAAAKETILFDPKNFTNHLQLSTYQWSPRGDAILVSGENDLWLVPLPGGQPRRLTHDAFAEELPTFSPDGQYVAFGKRNNLFVLHVRSGRVRQLTFNGSETIRNGKRDWVYNEEFSHVGGTARAYEWSPDGKKIVFLRLDESPVPQYPITDFLRPHPTVTPQRYPNAGDPNPLPAVLIVDAAGPNPLARAMPLGTNAEYVVPTFSWTPDAKSVCVMTLNRAQNELSVFQWRASGWSKPQLVLKETDPCWVNVFAPPHFLKDGQQFLWLSERDGWMHAYRFNADGTLRQQITRGPWQIEPNFSQAWSLHPFQTDPANEWLYFSATEKDPRERQLCRVRCDGSGFEQLTREPGTHFQKLSPDGRYLLETFSSVDRPPAVRILRADGTPVATLEQREDRWKTFATAPAEFHEITAPDGTKLFAQLTKPADFNPAKKYPVIVYVYGGPQFQIVRHQWPAVNARHQLLAQAGFLIWSLDNRGSWGRGHAWETAVHKNLGARELADQLAGIAHLKTLPFVDTNRFGLWGWSYGGYMTLYSLTHAPDVFKCGVAGAPVSDWKFYDTIYTERYLRPPQENPGGYKTSSPLAAAGKLKAKLLIIHGTADDNVHMQNTLNFVDALVKANRPYELQIQPGQMHGFSGEAANQFVAEQLVDFFKRNL